MICYYARNPRTRLRVACNRFHYVFQEAEEDKIYYIVARSLINAIERFYKLRPNNKIRLIRLPAERDLGSLSMRTNLTVCAE